MTYIIDTLLEASSTIVHTVAYKFISGNNFPLAWYIY